MNTTPSLPTATGPQTLSSARARNAALRAQQPQPPDAAILGKVYDHAGLARPESPETRTLSHLLAENMRLEGRLALAANGGRFDFARAIADFNGRRELLLAKVADRSRAVALNAKAEQLSREATACIEAEIAADKNGDGEASNQVKVLLRDLAHAVSAKSYYNESLLRDCADLNELRSAIETEAAREQAEMKAKCTAALALHRTRIVDAQAMIANAAAKVKAQNANNRASANQVLAQFGASTAVYEQFYTPAQKAAHAREIAKSDQEEISAVCGSLQTEITKSQTHIATLEAYLEEPAL